MIPLFTTCIHEFTISISLFTSCIHSLTTDVADLRYMHSCVYCTAFTTCIRPLITEVFPFTANIHSFTAGATAATRARADHVGVPRAVGGVLLACHVTHGLQPAHPVLA
jgi:hypothetical protein